MAGAKKHNDRQLMAIRRTIESDFSLLTYYNAENNRARSLTGFQARLEKSKYESLKKVGLALLSVILACVIIFCGYYIAWC